MNVDDVVAARIAAARLRAESAKKARATRKTARDKGLAQRHAAKLRAQADRRAEPTPTTKKETPMSDRLTPAQEMTERVIEAAQQITAKENPMRIAPGSVINLAPAPAGWTVTVYLGGDESRAQTFPIIGWATVVGAHLNDGTTTTTVQAAFNYNGEIFTEAELREFRGEPVALRVESPPMLLADATA